MRLGPMRPNLEGTLKLLLAIAVGLLTETAVAVLLLMLRSPNVRFPMPRMTLAMLLQMFLIAANLRRMLLTRTVLIVVFLREESSMWWSEPLSALLQLRLSGLVTMWVMPLSILLIAMPGWTKLDTEILNWLSSSGAESDDESGADAKADSAMCGES